MRKLLLLWIALLAFGVSYGQNITNYAFSASSGTFTPITGGTAVSTSTSAADFLGDTKTSIAIPIGFTFYYMGVPYTQLVAMSDGYVSFNLSATSSLTNSLASSGAAQRPLLAPLWDDLDGASGTGAANYITEGSAGSRIFTIEWLNWQWNYGATGATISFQIKLYEGTGKVEFIYSPAGGAINSASASIGITGVPTGAGNYLSLSDFSTSPTVSSTTETTSIAALPAAGQIYTFTPPATAPTAPTNLTFSAISATGMTLNWNDSPDEVSYSIYRSLDGVSYTYIATLAANTISYVATGLTPNTPYYWKVSALNEAHYADLYNSQATNPAVQYYWVGTTGGTLSTSTNWNTAADGSGSSRTTTDISDILIVDGDGTTPGGSTTINVDVASFSLGQFKVTSNTNLTLQSSATTTRTITLIGGSGYDFVVENGCTLNLNNATMAVAFDFSGAGNTGDISGTINFAGSSSNKLTTTGGTGTLVNVSSTGVVNLGYAGNSLVGSTATLNFDNGAKCNSTGATTGAPPVPLATWAPNATLTISGLTTSTTSPTNNAQSFGNVIYNCPAATGTFNFWGSTSTAVVKGDLNIIATNTGRFRAVSSGTLTVNGDINVSGGSFQVSGTTGTVIVLGNVNVAADSLDIAAGGASTLKVAGNFIQTGGKVKQTNTGGLLEFNGTSAQTLTLIPGFHGTNALNIKINNEAGVNLTSDASIRNLTVTNGNLDGVGVVAYNGTSSVLTYNGSTGLQVATAAEFPLINGPSSLTVNNTSTYPNNMVVLPFSRRLNGTSGVLTLTAGLLSVPANVLSISNTATTAISGGSASSYVFGGLERDLPASLATGSTYNFPVGKSKYNPFALVNPTTNAGGIVTVKAEVQDGNCSGTAGALLQSLHTNIYWEASVTAGSANFTNSLIQLNDSVKGADAIAASATVNGTYDIVGGLTVTSTATSLTSTAPESTTLPGFYVMANKAAPVVDNVAITPTGNQCTNVARTVTATVTPGGGAITAVVINYSVDGTPQTPVVMTNVSGNDWSGIIPTVTPVNATVTWSVEATDANLLVGSAAGVPYTDEPNLGISATASISQAIICSGNADTLSVDIPSTEAIIGTATTLTGTTSQPTAFCNRWPSYKMQLVYTASELTAAGLKAGEINSMSYEITTLGDASTNANFLVKIGTTSLSTLTDFVSTTGFTTVFPAATYTHAVGVNVIPFSTPFVWDGISNIIVEVSHDGADMTYNAQTYYTQTAGNTVAHAYSGNSALLSTYRLNTVFTQLPAVTSYSWSDGSTIVGTTNPLYLNPLSNTSYTATAVISGCPIVSNTVSVTTNPLPSTPTANNSTQCGVAVPTCSVTSTSGAPSPVFNWYDVATGGTPLAGITGNTYTGAAISTTTYFYVAEFNGTCESERVMVTATVGAAPVLTLSNDTSICNNTVATLSVTSILSDYDAYTWDPITDLYLDPTCATPYISGATASIVYVKSTTPGIATYTCNATNSVSQCSNVATVDVTVLPANPTAVASTESICHSGSSSISITPATGWDIATFQWMESSDNITFNDIVGATAIDYTTPVITDTTYYKLVVELGSTVCTESSVVVVNVNNPQIISTTPATRCGEGSVNLSATATSGATTSWYDSEIGGSLLGSGTTFTTPVITTTTTYYTVAELLNDISAGRTAPTSTSSDYWTGYGLVFSTTKDIILNSVDVYPSNSTPANMTIQLLDNTGTQVAGTSNVVFMPISGSGATSQTVNLGYFIPAGTNYRLVISSGMSYSNKLVQETSGYTYPIASGCVSVTSNWNGTGTSSTYYDWFYNWDVTEICADLRTAVTATVNPAPIITVTANPTTICQGENSTIEATSSNSGYSYTWEPGTLSGSNVSVSPLTSTTYNVTASDNSGGANDGCIIYGSVSIDVNPSPVLLSIDVSDNIICAGETIDLFADAVSGDTYLDSLINEGFETFPPVSWVFLNAGSGNSWTQSTTYYSGAASMAYRWNSSYAADAWAFTSPLSLNAGTTYTVSFWYKTGSSFEEKMKVTVGDDTTVVSQTNVLWDNNGGNYLLTSTWTQGFATFTPTISGVYHFGFNCYSDADMYYLYVDDVVISVPMNAPATFAWTSVPAGFTSSDQNPVAVAPGATTQYVVTASNSYGCSTSADTTVTVNPIPSVYLGADQDICDTTTITLDAGNTGSSFNWSTGGSAQTESILGADLGAGANVVSVTVTSAAGCIGYDEVTITVTICDGIEDPTMHISYYPNPATDMLNLDLSELPAGDYRFEMFNMQGQKVMNRVLVNDGNVILVNLLDVAPGSYVISVTGNNNSFRNYLTIQE